jgi:hypothetical protein
VSDGAFLRALADCIVGLTMEGGGQGNTTRRRLDKSGSPDVIQALDRACLSLCRSVGSRAAPRQNANDFNGISGTAHFPTPGVRG